MLAAYLRQGRPIRQDDDEAHGAIAVPVTWAACKALVARGMEACGLKSGRPERQSGRCAATACRSNAAEIDYLVADGRAHRTQQEYSPGDRHGRGAE